MDTTMNTNATPTTSAGSTSPYKQTLLIRQGRGRTGGSTGLDFAIQRARHQGRRVKPLDGDLRSGTLTELYPPSDKDGNPVEDAASSPLSEEPRDMQSWLATELDQMVRGKISAVLDLGGGERVIDDFVRELNIPVYCKRHGIRLVTGYFIGPDPEDFAHVRKIMRADVLKSPFSIFFLNEGVIRQGQTTEGVFDPLLASEAYRELSLNNVRSVFVRRLTCLTVLRERGLSFYDAIEGRPDRFGHEASPTLQFMVDQWLEQAEDEHTRAGTLGWMP